MSEFPKNKMSLQDLWALMDTRLKVISSDIVSLREEVEMYREECRSEIEQVKSDVWDQFGTLPQARADTTADHYEKCEGRKLAIENSQQLKALVSWKESHEKGGEKKIINSSHQRKFSIKKAITVSVVSIIAIKEAVQAFVDYLKK